MKKQRSMIKFTSIFSLLFFVSTTMWAQYPANGNQGAPPANGQQRTPGNFQGKNFSLGSQQPKTGYGKITGKIVDEESNEPVPFTTVALIDQKTKKPVDGTIADEKGKFEIKSVPEGIYNVTVSFIGYETIERPGLEITDKGNSIDLGTIGFKTKTTQLDEVVVETQRELIEEKVDRIVYNAEKDETTQGGDATDVLRRVPLLSVDLDGNVSLRGSQNIKVLIDNRPSTITAGSIADALKQIPADQIKSVEVITSPSARYDAEGTGGIINIITKKNNLQGASLSINSSAGLRGSNLGLNAGYRKGRTGFTLGGFGRAGYNIKGSFDNEQLLSEVPGGLQTLTTQSASSTNNMLHGRYNLGWDYEFNKYNWISASVKFGLFNFNGEQDNRLTRTFQDNNLLNSSLQDVNFANLSNTVDISLNYIKTYEKERKELSILSLYSQNNRTNNFENINLETSSESIVDRFKNENDSYNKEMTLQVDYVSPINDKQSLEMGGKNIMRLVTSDYQYYYGDGADGPYVSVPNANLTNVFDYQQNVSAGYLSYTVDFLEKYSAKVGGRYEYTSIAANFQNEDELDIPSYGVFVPSIHLSRKLKQGNMIKASYNRRIQRPSLRFLNPNIQAANPKDITQGNPNLDPEYTDNFELSYSTFKKGTSLNFSAFMRNTNGSIQPVREVLGQDTVFTTYRNIGEEDAYGLSIFANVNISKKLMVNGGIDTYYSVLNNNVDDPIYNASNEGFVVSGRLFGSYNVTPQWAVQFFGFMRGRRVELQGYRSGFYIYSLSVNRKFKDDRGSIGIGAENFFTNQVKMKSEIISPLVIQHSTNVMHNMNFKINFSYRIGKMDVNPTQRRRKKSIENNDLKEGENNNQIQMIN